MTAPAVLAALAGVTGAVEVTGSGPLAAEVRRLLGARPSQAGGAPAAVVETTGERAAVAEALRRVATLGTVVLAGPVPSAPVTLDLYADLHVRGLTVVGLPTGGAADRP